VTCFDSLIVDLDGVVWREGRIIPENAGPLAKLIRSGTPIVFLTNNSTRERRVYARLLTRALRTPITAEDVVNSGYSAARWLAKRLGPSPVLPVGEEGLAAELALAGHEVLTPGEWQHASAVAVGLDRGLNYRKLAAAHRAISSGAVFVATNRDLTYPVGDGLEPGAGSIVALLEASTGRIPDFDAGKPGEWILGLALERLRARGATRPLVVGDRIDTDIEMAARAGLPSLLLLTGVTSEPPEGLDWAPTLADALAAGAIGPC